jgi:hypothetical protein
MPIPREFYGFCQSAAVSGLEFASPRYNPRLDERFKPLLGGHLPRTSERSLVCRQNLATCYRSAIEL